MPRLGIELRSDFDATELRLLARKSRDVSQSRRLLSLAAVYDGLSRADSARIGGMDRQTLRDWVHRFNENGVEGLIDRKSPGAKRRLDAAQLQQLAEIIEAGPSPDKDQVVRWRRVDLQAIIQERFGVAYHERSVSRLLHEMGFSHISARPQHPKQDTQAIEDFKKTSPTR